MAELSDEEKDAISHRVTPRASYWHGSHALNGAQRTSARSRAAAVSIVSNTILIVLKIVAGFTGLGRDPHRGAALGHRPARQLHRLLLRPPR